jgi:hypothetical protein
MPIADVDWLEHYEDARARARESGRMILAKPAGQGMCRIDKQEFW